MKNLLISVILMVLGVSAFYGSFYVTEAWNGWWTHPTSFLLFVGGAAFGIFGFAGLQAWVEDL